MAYKLTPHEIRALLEKTLTAQFQQPLDDAMWDGLVDMGAVATVQAGHRDPAALVTDVERIWKMAGKFDAIMRHQRRRPSRMLHAAAITREEVRSLLLARLANQDEGVRHFRQKYLSGRVLERGEVREWIVQAAKKDGPATRWLTVPLPKDVGLRATARVDQHVTEPDCTINETGGGAVRIHLLHYPDTPDAADVSKIPIARNGILGALYDLSASLADRYGWQRVQATEFVLTNGIPVASAIREELRDNDITPRIILDLDPFALPRDVMAAYRDARKELFQVRPRTLSVKHLRLAAFTADRPPDEPWAETMARWNRAHPKLRYTSARHFARDVTQSHRRLIQPGLGTTRWSPPGTRGEHLAPNAAPEAPGRQRPTVRKVKRRTPR